MPTDAAAEVKARLDIVEVIGGYVALQRSGRGFKGLCPFHAEKTPSFTVSQERQAWYCHGCSQGGDVYTFIEQVERVGFRQALEMLAERAGVELEQAATAGERGRARRRRRTLELNERAQAYYSHVLWATAAGAAGRALLGERAVSEEAARRFGTGFAPAGGVGGDALMRYLATRGATVEEMVDAGLALPARGGQARDRFRNRLLFPIRDERGATLGFGGRGMGDAVPKYLNTADTAVYRKSSVLFGLDLARAAITREHAALVVEGYFDVIAAHAAGIEHVVASSGTALTREQVRILSRYASTLTLCFDGDNAGRAAASRAVDVVAAEGLTARICVLPAGVKDPDEMVRGDAPAFAAMVAAAPPEWQVLLDAALGDAEGGSVDARRAAAERCIALLARIPEAATRDLYAQQAARRLDITAQSLTSDVARVLREGRRALPRVVLPPPAARPDEAESAPDPGEGIPMPQWEVYLGSIVVHRPSLARVLTGALGLDVAELTHPTVQQLLRVALALDGGDMFPVHRLSPADQRRAAELMVRDIPELSLDADPALLERALRDCVRRVREESVLRSLATIKQELRRAKEDGREEEVQLLAARVTQLAAETHRLRGTLAPR